MKFTPSNDFFAKAQQGRLTANRRVSHARILDFLPDWLYIESDGSVNRLQDLVGRKSAIDYQLFIGQQDEGSAEIPSRVEAVCNPGLYWLVLNDGAQL